MPASTPRRALVVIDVQNEYIDGGFRIEHPPVAETLPNIERAMDFAQQQGMPVVVVQRVLPATVLLQSTFAAVLATDAGMQAVRTGQVPERDNIFASNQRALAARHAGA